MKNLLINIILKINEFIKFIVNFNKNKTLFYFAKNIFKFIYFFKNIYFLKINIFIYNINIIFEIFIKI